MKEKMKHYAKEIVLFSVVMILFANLLSLYRSMDLNKEPLQEYHFTLIDNEHYSVDTTKPLLIHFWATWCPTCRVEADTIEYLSKHFEVLTIAVKSGSNQELQNFMQEQGYTFRVLNDAEGRYARKYLVSGFPTSFIYNKKQEHIFSDVGYTSLLGMYLRLWWANL